MQSYRSEVDDSLLAGVADKSAFEEVAPNITHWQVNEAVERQTFVTCERFAQFLYKTLTLDLDEHSDIRSCSITTRVVIAFDI